MAATVSTPSIPSSRLTGLTRRGTWLDNVITTSATTPNSAMTPNAGSSGDGVVRLL